MECWVLLEAQETEVPAVCGGGEDGGWEEVYGEYNQRGQGRDGGGWESSGTSSRIAGLAGVQVGIKKNNYSDLKGVFVFI